MLLWFSPSHPPNLWSSSKVVPECRRFSFPMSSEYETRQTCTQYYFDIKVRSVNIYLFLNLVKC